MSQASPTPVSSAASGLSRSDRPRLRLTSPPFSPTAFTTWSTRLPTEARDCSSSMVAETRSRSRSTSRSSSVTLRIARICVEFSHQIFSFTIETSRTAARVVRSGARLPALRLSMPFFAITKAMIARPAPTITADQAPGIPAFARRQPGRGQDVQRRYRNDGRRENAACGNHRLGGLVAHLRTKELDLLAEQLRHLVKQVRHQARASSVPADQP